MANYAGLILAESTLVSYWRLGETSGTNAADSKGSNAGTYTGGFTLAQPSLLVADSDPAVLLNGTTGKILYGDIFDFAGTSAFTLECWLKWDGTLSTLNKPLFAKMSTVGGNNGYVVFVAATTQALDLRRYLNGTLQRAQGGAVVSGAPTHAVVTYDASNIRCYLNGALVAGPTASSQSLGDHANAFNIGADPNFSSGFFPGVLDEAAVYNAALSAAAIAAHYAEGVSARQPLPQMSNQTLSRAASF